MAEKLHQDIPEGTAADDYAETLIKRIEIGRLKEKRDNLIASMQNMDAAQRAAAMKEVSMLNASLHKLNDNFFRR